MSFHLIHGHSHARIGCLSVFFLLSFSFSLKFLFHLFLIPAMVPEDSMNTPLCHSAIESMVTFDYVTPDTVAVRSKAKAKPQQREPVDTPTIIPMHERRWIDIEPSEQTLAAYDLSKKVISLLRHNQTVQREEDGAIQFYRIKFIFGIIPHKYSIGLMIVGNLVWQQEEVRKRDISIALIIREESFTSELFRDTLETISLIPRYRTMW